MISSEQIAVNRLLSAALPFFNHGPVSAHTINNITEEAEMVLMNEQLSPSTRAMVMQLCATCSLWLDHPSFAASVSRSADHRQSSARPVVTLTTSRKREAGKGSVAAPIAVQPEGAQRTEKTAAEVTNDFEPLMRPGQLRWSDLVGMDDVLERVKDVTTAPFLYPALFTGIRTPAKRILLYGPPGTGKSSLAEAVATELGTAVLEISAADLLSKWVGESEKFVRDMFAFSAIAKPIIVLLDEIDALCSSRGSSEAEASRRIKTEFLVRMQRMDTSPGGSLLIATTNVPWELDTAILRRFDHIVPVGLPDAAAIVKMLQHHLRGEEHCISDEAFLQIASRSFGGYSGADVRRVCSHAATAAIFRAKKATAFCQDDSGFLIPCNPSDKGALVADFASIDPRRVRLPPLVAAELEEAATQCRPTITQEELQQFDAWRQRHNNSL